jgi:hypothetical protein
MSFIPIDPRPDCKDGPPVQKGIRERLLCGCCEGYLSKFETYAADVLRSLPSTENKRPGDIVRVTGIDYAKFKVFQLSILWRCSIASKKYFKDVQLGHHEETVRNMIKTADPGKAWQYGCVIAAFRSEGSLKSMVKFPGRLRVDGHYGYHLVLWGLAWIFVVSSHAQQLKEKGSFLQDNGLLPIMVTTKTIDQFFAEMAGKLTKAGKNL